MMNITFTFYLLALYVCHDYTIFLWVDLEPYQSQNIYLSRLKKEHVYQNHLIQTTEAYSLTCVEQERFIGESYPIEYVIQ